MAITFQFQKQVKLKDRIRLKGFLEKMLAREGRKPGSVSFVFCTDEFLLDINTRFLNHNYYTDIVTFDLSEGAELNAEVFISVDRVKENAVTYQQPFNTELHRVVFHGVLHLCGYKDKNPVQKKLMRSKENSYLKAYFTVPRSTVS